MTGTGAGRPAAAAAVLVGVAAACDRPVGPVRIERRAAAAENTEIAMRTLLRRLAPALAAATLVSSAGTAWAADPLGTWLTEGGKSRVRVADCGGALCGSIVWLKEPNNPETGQPKTDRFNPDQSKRSRPVIG